MTCWQKTWFWVIMSISFKIFYINLAASVRIFKASFCSSVHGRTHLLPSISFSLPANLTAQIEASFQSSAMGIVPSEPKLPFQFIKYSFSPSWDCKIWMLGYDVGSIPFSSSYICIREIAIHHSQVQLYDKLVL